MKYINSGIKNIGSKSGKVKVILLLVLLLAIIIGVLFFTGILGGGGFGLGGGGGSGSPEGSSDSSASEETSNIISIRIEESSIYFGDELCADKDELKKKITDTGNTKEYELIHDNAIKSVYDEVIEVLAELETALEIKVNYN